MRCTTLLALAQTIRRNLGMTAMLLHARLAASIACSTLQLVLQWGGGWQGTCFVVADWQMAWHAAAFKAHGVR
jgi:hypothetical protein